MPPRRNFLPELKKYGFGGYKPGSGRGKKFKVSDSFGTEVLLQSSYELTFSKLLDDNQIEWLRPTYLRYGNRKYFPDFYLPKFDLYLDTKNDYLIKLDADKIKSVTEENSVRLVVISKRLLDEAQTIPCLADWLKALD